MLNEHIMGGGKYLKINNLILILASHLRRAYLIQYSYCAACTSKLCNDLQSAIIQIVHDHEFNIGLS